MARGVGDGVHEGPVGKFGGVEGACAFVGDVARFVVRKQVQARIEGRHGSDRNVEIVVRGVESRAARTLRDGESQGLSVAGEKKRRTAGRTRILGKGHVDLGVPCRSFFCGEGQPVGFFGASVTLQGAGALTVILPLRARWSSDRKSVPPLMLTDGVPSSAQD